jgi:hypothetical protein
MCTSSLARKKGKSLDTRTLTEDVLLHLKPHGWMLFPLFPDPEILWLDQEFRPGGILISLLPKNRASKEYAPGPSAPTEAAVNADIPR